MDEEQWRYDTIMSEKVDINVENEEDVGVKVEHVDCSDAFNTSQLFATVMKFYIGLDQWLMKLDFTDKTNRYKLSLLDIVGVTPTGMTFSIVFAYLEGERLNNVFWALQRFWGLFMKVGALPGVIVTDRDIFDECSENYQRLCEAEVTITEEMETISKRFKQLDVCDKVHLKTKLREIAYPDLNSMCPPLEKDSIENIIDVKADGSCGYHAIVVLLGMGEESWSLVHNHMHKELTSWSEEYINLLGGIERFEELKCSLLVDGLSMVTIDK
ncbi:uncharacterized protein LOC114366816 [Glycine soja]|uniref:uncharacterized protein LOC114366816 n=1 Tax=Glycine soja TaxID=3848 RepID=UPI00103BBFBB|nr:uncharacterized protein LOC114366816 [Glycine soja]